ncbi:MAG TPA: response regulator [Candidatus Sulfotelmatobacter sp.]|jgi:DNA-binding response OmpR family regulator|nr:response regulator [Candidatus Sulfotelmatobacter sp.]
MKKILVAEDDKFLGSAYRAKLTKAGFEIQIARDGQEAMAMVRTFTPDLILLDLVMPIKDGFTVLEEIKNDPTLKAIPVIVASNLGQKEDTDRALKIGASDYFVKSDLSLNTIIEKIHNLIGV